jgi:hypothetical protein
MSSPPASNTADITRLRRQLAASQAVVEELSSKKRKRRFVHLALAAIN